MTIIETYSITFDIIKDYENLKTFEETQENLAEWIKTENTGSITYARKKYFITQAINGKTGEKE